MRYNWHPSGAYEPFELHHYIGNYISDAILALKEGGKPRLGFTRSIVSGLLERYADGTYQYRHSDGFNPSVAQRFKVRVDATVRPGVTAKELGDLAESLLRAIDKHYLIVEPAKTRKAIKKIKQELRAKRRK